MALPGERGRVASAWVVSVFAHLGLVGAGGYLVAHSLSAEKPKVAWAHSLPPSPDVGFDIELPRVAESSMAQPAADADEDPEATPRGGGEDAPRLDTRKRGRGGTDTAEVPALNLADRDEGMRLSREVLSRLDRDQIQRIRSSNHRASREDWRASREPMELTFLASGDRGQRPERRAPSAFDPSSGARASGPPRHAGGEVGGPEQPRNGFGERRNALGIAVAGARRASPGLGVRDGAPGEDARMSAQAAHARPMVPESTPSVPAEARGKPSDTTDSEQEVAARVQSLVHASGAGGTPGVGPGGQRGPGAPAAGGTSGAGSTSNALGTGKGAGLDVDPRDKRRTEYIRAAGAKVRPLYHFPKWAAIEGLSGTATVRFVILADGSVTGAKVTRPSGIPEYDEICRQAVLRAAPFAPLPPELGKTFVLEMPLESQNPIVRPKSSKQDRNE